MLSKKNLVAVGIVVVGVWVANLVDKSFGVTDAISEMLPF
jgi:hypothetical protein